MLRLVVVQNGKLKDKAVLELCDEYRKRFSRFGSLTVKEVKVRSGQSIWPKEADWRILLDEHGKQYDSPALAKQLQQWCMHKGTVAIAIGEAYGHDDQTKAEADCSWSLGILTLPHQLAHLVVIEQLYRAGTILSGTGYHHA